MICSASNSLVATISPSLFLTKSAFPLINALSGSTILAVNLTVLLSMSSTCKNAWLVGLSFKTSTCTLFLTWAITFPSKMNSVVSKFKIPAVSPALNVTV